MVQHMVEDSGDPTGFDAHAWLQDWLTHPVPALGNYRPLDILGRPEGLELIRSLLSCTQSGAYS